MEQYPSGEVDIIASLDSASALLKSDAEQAAATASEILDIIPGQPQALLLLMSALTLMGAEEGARGLLEWMVEQYPNLAAVRYELGLLLAKLHHNQEAAEQFSHAVALEPNHPHAWRALGHQLSAKGDCNGARRAYANHLRLSLKELKFLEDAAADIIQETQAEHMLRKVLEVNPTDVLSIRMLGEVLLRVGRLRESETILARALSLAPQCSATRYLYCIALTQRMDWAGANAELNILLKSFPNDSQLESLLITNLAMLGDREEAMRQLEKVKNIGGDDRIVWFNYALGARTVGANNTIVVEAYRKCLELDPSYGTAWWGLADLKTYRFSAEEIQTMREQLKRNDLSDGLRCHIEFALGSALEREKAYAESFDHYRKGNELRRPYIDYDADSVHRDTMRAKDFFTSDFFAARKDVGCLAPDPIFIVGMPRAGSTLVEQILASHSMVEGTMELPDLGDMVADLIKQRPGESFPEFLTAFDETSLRKLGEEYLDRTRYQRKLGKPLFTDKAGGNFVYLGLIQVILPNAKIIDARRHPLACGFSCYKQAFAPGALHFTYDQTEIGRYYRDYIELMAHFDDVLPDRVHRVIHETLIEEPEAEIRKLLAYCGLPFEENCLHFHETDRSVRTSSSEQVRQPIQKKTSDPWQHYQAWLGPMKDALGEVLTCYPQTPKFS